MRLPRVIAAILFLASATAILGFAPSSAFAAKKAVPSAKTTIMGTPAQLVEDLKVAGIDIVGDKFDYPELLPKAYRQGDCPNSRFLYNCRLDFDEDSKELVGFYLFTKPLTSEWNDAPRLHLGALNEMFVNGRARAEARYGKKYMSGIPNREFAYSIWVDGSPDVWFIRFDAWGSEVGEIIGGRAESVLTANRKDVNSLDKSRLSGAERLYLDLMQAGMDLGEPSSKPEVISSGYTDSYPGVYPQDSYEYRGFKNAYVWTEKKTGTVKEIELCSLSWSQAKGTATYAYLSRLFSKYPMFYAGALENTLSSGSSAMENKYGKASSTDYYQGGMTRSWHRYRVILDKGDRLQYISISVGYLNNGSFMLQGHFGADRVFVYAPAKTK